VLAWLSVWSEMQTCIWPSWCHCRSLSRFSENQIGFTFLVLAHPDSPGKRAVKRLCVCVCVCGLERSWKSWNVAFVFCGREKSWSCVWIMKKLWSPELSWNLHSVTRLLLLLLLGYQRELTYQRNDSSFSAFGNSDPSGSIWSVQLHVITLPPVEDENCSNMLQHNNVTCYACWTSHLWNNSWSN